MARPMCLLFAFFQVITYIPSQRAKYIGGTVSSIPAEVLGTLDVSDDKMVSFRWEKTGKIEAGDCRIAYNQVTALSYGQHAGRRVGGAVGVTAASGGLLAPVAVPLLLVKKRRHYLTIDYSDAQGKPQAAIFLVGKKVIGDFLKTLASKTGKKVEYEDEEARKSGEKAAGKTADH